MIIQNHKKGITAVTAIVLLLLMTIAAARLAYWFVNDYNEKNPLTTEEQLTFEKKCDAFCESKNFTYRYVDVLRKCACLDQTNTILDYSYDEEQDLFYRYA